MSKIIAALVVSLFAASAFAAAPVVDAKAGVSIPAGAATAGTAVATPKAKKAHSAKKAPAATATTAATAAVK